MALPILAGLGLMGGSALLNRNANRRIIEERNRKLAEERARQAALAQEAMGNFEAALAGQARAPQEQGIDSEAAARMQAYAQNAAAVPLTAAEAGNPLQSEIARRFQDAASEGESHGAAAARLGAFGGQQFNNRVALNRSGLTARQLQDFSQGSSAVLPMELEAAITNTARGTRQGADLMRLMGQAFVSHGLTAPKPGLTPDTSFSALYNQPLGGQPTGWYA